MLKRAVDNHRASQPHEKPLTRNSLTAKPFSAFRKPLPRPHQQPLSSTSANILPPKVPIPQDSRRREIAPSNGIKRTSNGLAKALHTQTGFEEQPFKKPVNSQKNPIVIDDSSPIKQSVLSLIDDDIYFDENDFVNDSDIDLDIEDPSTIGSISYPNLSTDPVPALRPSLYPTLPDASTTKSRARDERSDSGYGSLGHGLNPRPQAPQRRPPLSQQSIDDLLPWSSSPAEHLQALPKSTLLQRHVHAGKFESRSTTVVAEEILRPSKRRVLPWLQEQCESKLEKPDPQPQRTSVNKQQQSKQDRPTDLCTPLLKNKEKNSYPWNTTASALKEQQKNLRQANKKLDSHPEVPTDSGNTTISTRRKHIPRIFLSEEQQHVLSLVVEHKKSVFFTGSAGTGKSVLLREAIAALRKKFQREPDRVAVTASTGLAACNVGGVTLHSFAGIGLGKESPENLVKKIRRNPKAKARWLRTKTLIVDEISMVDGELFDKLEQIARIMRNNGRPFGGIQLVITGDFFQLPPVPDNGGRSSKFAFDANTWKSSIDHTIALHHVFRQKDPVFANMLNEMREGRLSTESIRTFHSLSRSVGFEDGLDATELFPTRTEVDAANNARMKQLVGDVKMFECRDGGTMTDLAQRHKLLSNSMAPEVIYLKKGAQVMLIKNMDETLVNGSLGRVIGFMNEQEFDSYQDNEEDFFTVQETPDDNLNPAEKKLKKRLGLLASTSQRYPVVRFAIPDGTTRDLLCQYETWKIEQPNGEVVASRSQIPLILAWALSIHKAQGQTLERVRVDLGKVFEKGQAYVALSRATSMQGLQILRFDPRKVVAHEKVKTFYAGLSRAEQAVGGVKSVLAQEKKKPKNIGLMWANGYEKAFVDKHNDEAEWEGGLYPN